MWTKTPPTEPGWYWARRAGGKPKALEIDRACGELFVVHNYAFISDSLSNFEWHPTPIPLPEEDQ